VFAPAFSRGNLKVPYAACLPAVLVLIVKSLFPVNRENGVPELVVYGDIGKRQWI
jgi:hypothetical protein